MKGLLNSSLRTFFSISILSLSLHVHSLELGKATIASALGEPISIHIPLDDAQALTIEDISVQLPKKALYDSFGLSYGAVHQSLDYALHVDYNDDVWLVIESDEAVVSPYFVYIVQLTWPSGQLIKEQVALIGDTPEIAVSYRPKIKSAPVVVSDIALADVPEAAPVPKGLNTSDIVVAGVPINPLANRTLGINKPPIDAQRLEEDAQAAVSDDFAVKKNHVDELVTQTQGVIESPSETLIVAAASENEPVRESVATDKAMQNSVVSTVSGVIDSFQAPTSVISNPSVTIVTIAEPSEDKVSITESLVFDDAKFEHLVVAEVQSEPTLSVASVKSTTDTLIELGKYSLFSRAGEPLDLFLPIKTRVPLDAEDFAVDVNVLGNTIEAGSNITILNPNQAMVELFTESAVSRYRGESIVLALSFVIDGQEVKKNIVITIK